jgi:hypothetical protein
MDEEAIAQWRKKIVLYKALKISACMISVSLYGLLISLAWRKVSMWRFGFAHAMNRFVAGLTRFFGNTPGNHEGFFVQTYNIIVIVVFAVATMLLLWVARRPFFRGHYFRNKRLRYVFDRGRFSTVVSVKWDCDKPRKWIITLRAYGRCANEYIEPPEVKSRLKKALRISHISHIAAGKRDTVILYATPQRYEGKYIIYRQT